MPKQVISVSLGSGTWQVFVDGISVGNFEGSWSGEADRNLHIMRVDTEHEDRAAATVVKKE